MRVRRGATELSDTQLPWNPNGTRWGSWIRATSGPVMSGASSTHSSLRVGRGVVHDGEDPGVVLGDAVGLRDDDRFGAAAAVAELVGLGRARLDVDLDDRAVQVRAPGDTSEV